MWFLLLVSIGCAQDTDAPVSDDQDTTVGPLLPTAPVSEDLVPETAEQVIAESARDASLQASGLAFYLEDKKALLEGEIREDWVLPELDIYRDEPWCHAPGAHGEHIPQSVDHPALREEIPLQESDPVDSAATWRN